MCMATERVERDRFPPAREVQSKFRADICDDCAREVITHPMHMLGQVMSMHMAGCLRLISSLLRIRGVLREIELTVTAKICKFSFRHRSLQAVVNWGFPAGMNVKPVGAFASKYIYFLGGRLGFFPHKEKLQRQINSNSNSKSTHHTA